MHLKLRFEIHDFFLVVYITFLQYYIFNLFNSTILFDNRQYCIEKLSQLTAVDDDADHKLRTSRAHGSSSSLRRHMQQSTHTTPNPKPVDSTIHERRSVGRKLAVDDAAPPQSHLKRRAHQSCISRVSNKKYTSNTFTISVHHTQLHLSLQHT